MNQKHFPAASKRTGMRGVFMAVILSATLLLLAPQPAGAQGGVALDLANAVNGLRAQYGLPPYQLNAALMDAAQSHTEWEAATGQISHTGAGGTTPTDRAVAAGYGDRSNVRVSENIYAGTNATSQTALDWWIGSPIHFRGLTSPNYSEIGVGVVMTDGLNYYTLVFGNRSSNPAPAPQAAPSSSGGDDGSPGAAPEPLPVFEVVDVEVSEAAEDGSVIHTVQAGQNVWDIAVAYDVAPSEILALNRLTQDAAISPGDELVIVPAEVVIEVNEDGSIWHRVEEGQSLWVISREYDVELERILEINGLTEASIIRPGDDLLVQPPTDGSWIEIEDRPKPAVYHTVIEGQFLYNIAAIHGVDLETILTLNNLTENSIIQPGDELLIRPADEPLSTPDAEPQQTDDVIVEADEGKPDDIEAEANIGESIAGAAPNVLEEDTSIRQTGLPRGALIGGLVLIAVLGGGLIAYGGMNLGRDREIQ